jgi:hypothetical protein
MTSPASVQSSIQPVTPPQAEATLEHSFEPEHVKPGATETPTDAKLTHHSRRLSTTTGIYG